MRLALGEEHDGPAKKDTGRFPLSDGRDEVSTFQRAQDFFLQCFRARGGAINDPKIGLDRLRKDWLLKHDDRIALPFAQQLCGVDQIDESFGTIADKRGTKPPPTSAAAEGGGSRLTNKANQGPRSQKAKPASFH